MKVMKPISAGILLSYKCSAACRHCMYACSPQWKGDWIPPKDLEKGLSQLRGSIRSSPWGKGTVSLNHGLHFTGGEPFLNFELLLKGVEIAEDLGIPSTFVETNCFWCGDDSLTREKLELLKEAGLKGILISVNPYYAEYVPFERTERCARISTEFFGHNVMVYQLEYYRLFKRLGMREKISLKDQQRLMQDKNLAAKVELFLMGRAASRLRTLYPSGPAHSFFDEPCRPPFFRDWHNHFDNYGNYMPGYCGGISLGNWLNLDNLTIDVNEKPVLGFLLRGDFRGLVNFAKDFGYEESAGGYVSKCDLCLDLRKHLVFTEDFAELRPREFYEHL